MDLRNSKPTAARTGGSSPARRLRREQRTVELMIRLYCRDNHRGAGRRVPAGTAVCSDCAALIEYSRMRVETCRFGEDKPVCTTCPVHCFRSEMREKIRTVMRYSGPRMTFRHPYLAVMHLLDRRRSPQTA